MLSNYRGGPCAPLPTPYDALRGKIVSFDGNIGLGKSTACGDMRRELLEHGIVARVFDETFDDDLLASFGADPVRYGALMNASMATRRMSALLKAEEYVAAHPSHVAMLDTSMVRDRVFADVNRDMGSLRAQHVDVLARLVDALYESTDAPVVDLAVLLDSSVPLVERNIVARGRAAEAAIPSEYLQRLRERHLQVFQPCVADAGSTTGGAPLMSAGRAQVADRAQVLEMRDENGAYRSASWLLARMVPLLEAGKRVD